MGWLSGKKEDAGKKLSDSSEFEYYMKQVPSYRRKRKPRDSIFGDGGGFFRTLSKALERKNIKTFGKVGGALATAGMKAPFSIGRGAIKELGVAEKGLERFGYATGKFAKETAVGAGELAGREAEKTMAMEKFKQRILHKAEDPERMRFEKEVLPKLKAMGRGYINWLDYKANKGAFDVEIARHLSPEMQKKAIDPKYIRPKEQVRRQPSEDTYGFKPLAERAPLRKKIF